MREHGSCDSLACDMHSHLIIIILYGQVSGATASYLIIIIM
jgi:hypothetical protein